MGWACLVGNSLFHIMAGWNAEDGTAGDNTQPQRQSNNLLPPAPKAPTVSQGNATM